MNAAIQELAIALHVAETNEPINRAAGNTEQADLEAKNAEEFKKAIAILEAAEQSA